MALLELLRHLRWMSIHYGPARDVTIETRNGSLTFSSKDWLPGKYLYVRRGYEEDETATVVELLRAQGALPNGRGGTVLNIGANIGMTCIGLLRREYFERAVAIEPAPGNYRLLVHNIEQNGLAERVVPLQLAISSSDGSIEMELSRDNPGDHRIREANRPGFHGEEKRKTIQVAAKTLDTLAADQPRGMSSADLVWIDIQGHEGHLWKGARKFFARSVPVASEFWPYGIDRSGVSRQEYCELVCDMFTSFFLVGGAPAEKRPIKEFEKLFEMFPGPRQIGLVVLLNEGKR